MEIVTDLHHLDILKYNNLLYVIKMQCYIHTITNFANTATQTG